MSYQRPKRPLWLQWTVTITAFILFFMFMISYGKHKMQINRDLAAYEVCKKNGCPKTEP